MHGADLLGTEGWPSGEGLCIHHQQLLQLRPAPPPFRAANANADGLALADQYDEPLATLEPVVLGIYEHARKLASADFFAAVAEVNAARRHLGAFDPSVDARPLLAAARERGVPMVLLDVAAKDAAAVYRHKLVLSRPDQHAAWRDDHVPADPLALVDLVRGALVQPAAEFVGGACTSIWPQDGYSRQFER